LLTPHSLLYLPTCTHTHTSPQNQQKVITAETVSYDFLTLLDNGVNNLGVTDRLMALSEYASSACAQKALACPINNGM
jgi:hypothetical protein